LPTWPAAKLGDAVIGADHHAAARNLQKLGVSPLGAQQFLKGEAVLSRNDRLVLSRIVLQSFGDAARPLEAIAHLRIRWGLTPSGAMQFVVAEIVTDEPDRIILARQASSHAVGVHEITGAIVKIN
jgi:hypothetical protein